MIKTATPYLTLHGKADQAIGFYQQALGAKLEMLQRFGDMQPNCPEALKNHVMHAQLQVGHALLMMSDGAPDASSPTSDSARVQIALEFDDVAQARTSFDALASNGQVVQPLIEAPWGALFGALRDQFGVNWMFNVTMKK